MATSLELGVKSFFVLESGIPPARQRRTAHGGWNQQFMGTIVPTAALATRGGAFAVDLGTGLAFFTNYKFGVQDFGGPVQIIAITGISLAPAPGFRAGYRFQHFSDAGTYGPTSLGVDMHLLEMGYLF